MRFCFIHVNTLEPFGVIFESSDLKIVGSDISKDFMDADSVY